MPTLRGLFALLSFIIAAGHFMASALPKPGELVFHDFRQAKEDLPGTKPIKILQWNIERGYKLDALIEEMKLIDADVLAIQEIDIMCERSGFEDTGVKIAQALGLNYVFVTEFEELHSPLRDRLTQGGGVHGNGIMSKYNMSNFQIVEHKHHPVDWENPTLELPKREPRHGRRLTLGATVHTNQGDVFLYTAHLEVFCGMLDRVQQFSDILRHSRGTSAAGIKHQVIAGDLNTMAHGVARLSPNYCTDKMRWRTLGYSEAEVWDKHILSLKEDPSASQPQINQWLLDLGLPEDVCRDVVNPGFSDPWDPKEITLDHPSYRIFGYPLMAGKLDWILMRGMNTVEKSIGNHEFDKSDHKWLMVHVNLQE